MRSSTIEVRDSREKLSMLRFLVLVTITAPLVLTQPFQWQSDSKIVMDQDLMFDNTPSNPHALMTGSAERSISKTVSFFPDPKDTRVFSTVPQVLIGIQKLECLPSGDLDYDITITSITKTNFVYQMAITGNQICLTLISSWLATDSRDVEIKRFYFDYLGTSGVGLKYVQSGTGYRVDSFQLAFSSSKDKIPRVVAFPVSVLIVPGDSQRYLFDVSTSATTLLNFNLLVSTNFGVQIKKLGGFWIAFPEETSESGSLSNTFLGSISNSYLGYSLVIQTIKLKTK